MEIGPYYAQDSMYYKTADQRILMFNEMMSEELGRRYSLPMCKEVCDVCQGEGSISNRSIDGNGLDPNDPDLDDDFWNDYRAGVYDVVCDECNGLRVINVINESIVDSDILSEWEKFNTEIDNDVAYHLSEMRMGA